MFRLTLLGGAFIEEKGERVTGPSVQRHRMALLALLAAARPRGMPRDKVMAWLWPETDDEHARGLLNQTVYVLRRALGAEAVLSVGEELQLNQSLVSCDMNEFEAAVAAGDLARAAGSYAGPFLDGFFLDDAPEFDQWAGRERVRLAEVYARALEGLAERAAATGERSEAVKWWKARSALDPYDSSVVRQLMLALDASGNRAAALMEAGAHQRVLREALEMDPPRELLELAERLRTSPGGSALREGPAAVSEPPRVALAGAGPALSSTPPRRRPLFLGALVLLVLAAGLGAVRLARSGASRPAPAAVVAGSVDEIAKAVARELERRQQGDTIARPAPRRTSSIAAYELYLRGDDPRLLRSDSAARLALDYLRRAVALDSNYAAAWAGLARMTMRVAQGVDTAMRRQALDRAEAAARRSVVLDDSLGDAHATLGLMLLQRRDAPSAERHLLRAAELDPAGARNHEWLVRLYVAWGKGAKALEEGKRAVALEPLSPTANAELARAHLANGQCDEALARLARIGNLDPPLQRAASIAAQCYARKGMWREAVAALRQQGERRDVQTLGLYGYLLGRAGERVLAGQLLDTLLRVNRERPGQGLNIALVQAGLGHRDEALGWLDRAVSDYSLFLLAEPFPTVLVILDATPRDPRVVALRKRLGIQNR